MQPAGADVVENWTVTAAAATARALRGARMSLPSCLPAPRGSPKSSTYETWQTTGNTITGTGFAPPSADPAWPRNRRHAITRAVVRLPVMGFRFALEAQDPSRHACGSRRGVSAPITLG